VRRRSDDSAEEKALEMLEKENEAFENHRIWRALGLRPAEFFQGVRRYLSRSNVPEREIRRAIEDARAVSERKVRETRGRAQRNVIPLGLIRV